MLFLMHAVEYASRANGPGLRAVIWFQGCTLNCPGCFNPNTHLAQIGTEGDTEKLARELLCRKREIEGVTFSGGEPFQQSDALLDILQRLADTTISKLVFSGYTLREIQALPLGNTILGHLDVLIAGRYIQSKHLGRQMLGSSNQKIHLLGDRYSLSDLQAVPQRELIVKADGTLIASGISPWVPCDVSE